MAVKVERTTKNRLLEPNAPLPVTLVSHVIRLSKLLRLILLNFATGHGANLAIN